MNHFKQVNWITFAMTVMLNGLISGGTAFVSYMNAISEIKQQIAVTKVDETYLKETITEMKDDYKAQRKEMDEIKNLLLTKRQLDDIKTMILAKGNFR